MATDRMIRAKINALNRKLGRPAMYFTRPDGKPSHAAVGHLVAHRLVDGYQLAEVSSDAGDENPYVFGLTGERLDSKCFYAVLNVLLACAKH